MTGAPGWFSDENLRKRASVAAEVDAWALSNLAEIMRSIASDPEPGPAVTLTERIEITADFCQCPACRAERCEP